MSRALVDLIHHEMPDGGKIAVSSEMIYLTSESLAWAMQRDLALQGRHEPYQFENFLTSDGKICRSALLNANAALIYLHPSLQYSRPVIKTSNDMIQYGLQHWFKDGTVQMMPLRNETAGLWGGWMAPKKPFTDAQITELIQGINAEELPPDVEFNPPVDKRLSWQECIDVLKRWKQKRLGENTGM